MAEAPFKALLVEGTSGVGKSTLVDALIRRHVAAAKPRKIRSLVHLAQSHTFGPLAVLEDRGRLTVEEIVRHLDGIVSHLEWLHASVQEHDRAWCFVIIDALPLTHCVRPGVVEWTVMAPFDVWLAALGCKLLFLEASPASNSLCNRQRSLAVPMKIFTGILSGSSGFCPNCSCNRRCRSSC